MAKSDVTKNPSGCSRTKNRLCKRCLEEKSDEIIAFIASVVKILAFLPTLMEQIAFKIMLRQSSVQQGTLLNQLTLTELFDCLIMFIFV
jgi:hypothetical protein